jgi:predicted MFS family arabinose efflux permease
MTEIRETVPAWRATLSATLAILVGVGLSRFAYTPLIPALITERWFTPAEAAYLGAANLAGYLMGALLTRNLAARFPAVPLLRLMMGAVALAFFACAYPLSFAWFFAWRLVSGFAGAVLMVLAAPTVLPYVPASRRGLAGGMMFTGVGLGIVISGTIVPWLLRLGLAETWYGLGGLSLVLLIGSWGGWPSDHEALSPPIVEKTFRAPAAQPAIIGLYVEYALNAVGLVPAMVFLVDFVARGLGAGIDVGAHYWVLFGVGAASGPMLLGRLADRIGFGRALRLAFLAQAIAACVLALTASLFGIALASLVLGACAPGTTTLVLGRVRELIPKDGRAQMKAWSISTTAFSIGQAGAAYGFSYVFARGATYDFLFELAAAALVLALAIDLAIGAVDTRHRELSADRR